MLPGARRTTTTWPNKRPLAIIPRHSNLNARLIAQGGRFTLHGRERGSLDTIATRVRKVKLARVKLYEAHIAKMWDDLDTAGINAFTIMKDLDSLAGYLKYVLDQGESGP